MGWGRKLYERCSRKGRIGMCDLPVHHTGECSMTVFDRGMRNPEIVPIDPWRPEGDDDAT